MGLAGTLPALLLALWCTAGGAIATYLYDTRAGVGARLCAGAAIGSALLGFTGYIASAAAGKLTDLTLLIAALCATAPLALLAQCGIRGRVAADLRRALSLRLPRRRRLLYAVFAALSAALFWVLFRGTVYLGADGGIWTNNHHNIGDLPFHFAVVQGFLVGDNYPPQHPEFAGARLTYPFLVDFINAEYAHVGSHLIEAIFVQNMLLGLALLGLLYRWVHMLTRSLFATIVAPLLVLFSGGLGFLRLIEDQQAAREAGISLWQFVTNLPHDYTRDESVTLNWGNSITTLLTTQRGLLLAIPIALMVLTLFWQDRGHPSDRRLRANYDGAGLPPTLRKAIAAGILTGALPLIHGHTILMLFLVGAGLAIQDLAAACADRVALQERMRFWALFYGIAIVLSLPQAYVLIQSSSVKGASFMGWQPGWDHGDMPLLRFWIWNLGLFLPLLYAAALWRRRGRFLIPPTLLRYYLPFLTCFVLANLVRLAPWIWDNMKMLFYWHLASCVLIALLLAKLWRLGPRVVSPLLSLVCVFFLTFAGALDVSRIAQGTLRQQTYDATEIAFAHAVIAATAPHALIVHYPQYNDPMTLTGRRLFYGFEGHLWSHGLNFQSRRRDELDIYAGTPYSAAVMERCGVDYVEMGPLQRQDPMQMGIVANEAYFRRYPVVAAVGPWVLYRVSDKAP